MKLVLDFLIFVLELVMLVCAIAFVVIAVRFVFSLAKEAVSARFPKAAKFVKKLSVLAGRDIRCLFCSGRSRCFSCCSLSLAPKLRVP